MASDESNDSPRSKLPYERHRRELATTVPAEQQDTPSLDPIQWNYVRKGLRLVFWGWSTVLAISGLFAAFWIVNFFVAKADADVIRTLGIGSGCIALAGGLVAVVGQCLCMGVPAVSGARVFIVGSVVATVITVLAIGMVIPQVLAELSSVAQVDVKTSPPQEGQLVAEPPAPDGAVPKDVVPKVDVPKDDVLKTEDPKVEPPPAPEPKVEPPMADAAAPTAQTPPPPDFPVSRMARLGIMTAYLVSQILFMLFIKRVALLFHNVVLAESTGAYVTLLVFHTALVALLPKAAMIACFFWVILLGLEVVLLVWFLMLLASTRRAVG